jgi:hypothetical protein
MGFIDVLMSFVGSRTSFIDAPMGYVGKVAKLEAEPRVTSAGRPREPRAQPAFASQPVVTGRDCTERKGKKVRHPLPFPLGLLG